MSAAHPADPADAWGLTMDNWSRSIHIDPAFLDEEARQLRNACIAARKAWKQAEADYKAAGGLVSTERGIEKDGSKAPCSNCLTWTSQKILHTEEREFNEADEVFQLIECAGCGRISMARTWQFDDERYGTEYYPSPVSRAQPWWVGAVRLTGPRVDMDHDSRDLFSEVYEALAGGQHRLAAMGVRALLEQVMVFEVGDHGSFRENLNAFCESGFISPLQREQLGPILDLGHAAMHRMYKPSGDDLNTALDIIEGILAAIYVHSNAATALSDRVPARRRTGRVVIPWKGHLRREPIPQDLGGESQ
jgi:hypothetical protein